MNRSRWQFHPLWLKMIETIEKLPRDTPGRAYNRGTDIRGRINKIDQSISGYLKARTALLALLHNAPPTNLDDAVDNLCSTLLDEINPIWFRDEVAERSKKYEVEL